MSGRRGCWPATSHRWSRPRSASSSSRCCSARRPVGPTLGASGGVFGLLLAYAFLFPKRKVIPLIPPIPMPAWLFATLYAGIELFLGVTGTLSGVAHFAHLGGMVGSAIVVMQWRASARGAMGKTALGWRHEYESDDCNSTDEPC